MQEFDRLPNDIVVIAATNRFDKLDPAFTDRFSAVHELEVFPIAESLVMVQEFLADVGYSLPEEKVLGICRQEQVQRKIIKAVVREIGNEILKEIEKNEPETEKGK
jgi:SpoVK/Ycf46/Vps4 family AAA+-type ATPase